MTSRPRRCAALIILLLYGERRPVAVEGFVPYRPSHRQCSVDLTKDVVLYNKNEGDEKEDPIPLDELSRREEEATRQRMNRLLLPDRIGRALNLTAYAFIAISFALNAVGYSFYLDHGNLTIDTIENVQFKKEMAGDARKARRVEATKDT